MSHFWRRTVNLPPLLILICMIMFIILTKQMKDLYDKNQKNRRMQSYNEFLNDVSDSMTHLETTFNKSRSNLKHLHELVKSPGLLSKLQSSRRGSLR